MSLDRNNLAESELMRDRNRDSMFGTMLLSTVPTDIESRVKQIQDPHQVMQQRLSDMHPLIFGDTIRLPVSYNPK